MPAVPHLATAALVVTLALAGCADLPRTGGPAPTPRPAATPPIGLDAEQRPLAQALRGTPAVVALDDDGALWVELPAARAFAPGQASPAPVLDTVLERVADSLRRVPAARLSVRLPAGPGGVVLADRRTAQLRVALARLGVAPTRVHAGPAAPPERVQLKIEVAALRPPAAARPVP